jgi:hypothetical protein
MEEKQFVLTLEEITQLAELTERFIKVKDRDPAKGDAALYTGTYTQSGDILTISLLEYDNCCIFCVKGAEQDATGQQSPLLGLLYCDSNFVGNLEINQVQYPPEQLRHLHDMIIEKTASNSLLDRTRQYLKSQRSG